jgi:hypothetical protein
MGTHVLWCYNTQRTSESVEQVLELAMHCSGFRAYKWLFGIQGSGFTHLLVVVSSSKALERAIQVLAFITC